MIKIKELRKQDYKKAVGFAIQGMHFDWYFDTKFGLYGYGLYFWLLELNRATHILAAYNEDEFVGVLLAEIYGEEKKKSGLFEKMYVKMVETIFTIFFKNSAGIYEATTKVQLDHYLESHKPDGEMIFLAVDPECSIKGVGSFLLNTFEEQQKGKLIYLNTDNACTYQFYERRGFALAEEDDIVLNLPKGKVPLKCMLYSKRM